METNQKVGEEIGFGRAVDAAAHGDDARHRVAVPEQWRRAFDWWGWRLARAALAPLSVAGAALAGYGFGLSARLDPDSRAARALSRRSGEGGRLRLQGADDVPSFSAMADQARASGRRVIGSVDGRVVVCRPGDTENGLRVEHATVLDLWRKQAESARRRTGSD